MRPDSAPIIHDVVQGSPEWLELRRGMLTASTIGQLIAPKTLKVAANDHSRALVAQLVAERVTGWVEPTFTSDAMFRGKCDEPLARDLYSKTYAPVTEVGFMTRDVEGVTIGASPDGLVGIDGMIEVKSRAPRSHLATILANAVPPENMAQMQAALLVSRREWCDYVSWAGGMPMFVKRVHRSVDWCVAIVLAAREFESTATKMIAAYTAAVEGLPTTTRIEYFQSEIKE